MSNLARLLLTIPPAVVTGVPNAGDAYGGGYYVGQMRYPDGLYALVIAPKEGELGATLVYADATVNSFSGNTSTYDGKVIRDNMVADGITKYPAQKWCMDLTIGGFTDWYLPAREELELCYRYLKPTAGTNSTTTGATLNSVPTTSNYASTVPAQTTATLFRGTAAAQRFISDYYWHATYSGTASDPGGLIRFTNGSRAVSIWNDTYYTRAVRRVYLGP